MLISEIIRKRKISETETSLRKRKALKRKGRLLKAMNKKNGSDFLNFVDSDVLPFINDVFGFPPGTTSYELTSKLSDKLFLECLEEANKTRYMLETTTSSSEKELKTKLSKCLKRLTLFPLTLALISYTYLANASTVEEFAEKYNKGHYKQAEKICHLQINSDAPNEGWIYNLGNTYVQEGKLADALVCYQRALLLDPRDQDALQNLNYVRRVLFLPEVYQTKTPVELLVYFRDILRPDEWLLLASFLFFALFMVLSFRRKISHYAFLSTALAILLLIALCLAIYFNQICTIYSSNNAIVSVKNLVVHTLPTDNSAEVGTMLSIGDDVKIQDKMEGWTLISLMNNKTIGWVKSDSVSQIWPY